MSNALAVVGKAKMDTLKSLFEKAKPSIAAVLPKHLTPERILKITLSAASRTPALLECTPESILLSVMQAAALGLEPNTPLGLSYLVPFRNKKVTPPRMEAQFIPGYRGLIRLASQSGEVLSVQARVVREKDFFEMEYGLDERLVHKPFVAKGEQREEPGEPQDPDGVPNDGGNPAGAMTGVYAVAVFKNGARVFDFMTRAEVNRIRNRSLASGSGPWVTDYEEMSKKTVIRRLGKTLPLATDDFHRALENESRAERGETPDLGSMDSVLEVLGSAEEPAQLPDGARVPATRTAEVREKVVAKVQTVAPKETAKPEQAPKKTPSEPPPPPPAVDDPDAEAFEAYQRSQAGKQ